ncbi:MAG TPA: cell envelope integrity protein TolA [Rhodanobacteraceae bacterium]|nr:cell envelope integrity protein TolA [Rhodanobacteraceae bacterium]
MESAHDKLRAFGLALGIHLLCLAALLVGLWWTHETQPVAMPGPVIEATLVGPTAAPKPRSGRTRTRPAVSRAAPPKPAPTRPEPAPPARAVPPPTEMQQDRIERERIAALAEQKAEQEKKEQEERHRQAQVLLEQQEKERKLAEQRQQQIADIRRQREAAEKKLALEKQRLAQLEDQHRAELEKAEESQAQTEHEAPEAMTGAGGSDNDLGARYAAAIQAAVTQNWNRPDSAQVGLRCVLRIIQIPGGEVISATVTSPCNADQATRNSIEQAVMKAAPLPYQGYEKVFQRSINFNFKYDG